MLQPISIVINVLATIVFCILSVDGAIDVKVNTNDNEPQKSSDSPLMNNSFSFSPLVKKVAPSIVNIYSERVQTTEPEQTEDRANPILQLLKGKAFNFDMLFAAPREVIQRSLGSGVVIGSEGVILTNVHVIKGATKIKVVLSDRRVYEAHVAVKDDKIDLAILKLNDSKIKLSPIEIGDPEAMEVGDRVVAIGNPFGVGTSVSTGVISAVSRFGGYIQTDASINPGNSGGALVNMRGQLVGVNNFIISKSGVSAGVGFSIPINMSKPALTQLKKGGGSVPRGWSGLWVRSVTPKIASKLNLSAPMGVVVETVHPNSGASDVKVGDVILELDGKQLLDKASYYYRLAGVPVGAVVSIKLLRSGKIMQKTFLLGRPVEIPKRQRTALKGTHIFNEVVIANLSPALEVELGLDSMRSGVIILGAVEATDSLKLFQKYDIIHSINGHVLKSVKDILKVLEVERVKKVKLLRNGQVVEIK